CWTLRCRGIRTGDAVGAGPMTCPRCHHDPADLVAFVQRMEQVYRGRLHPVDPEWPNGIDDFAYQKGAADALRTIRTYAEGHVVGEAA
ncbi:MAG: hypothetical protein ABIS21_08345, partial [Acidimicrobiales bacterium]